MPDMQLICLDVTGLTCKYNEKQTCKTETSLAQWCSG